MILIKNLFSRREKADSILIRFLPLFLLGIKKAV